jgi:hypothetical protein
MTKITIQHTQDCPNVEPVMERLRAALRQVEVDPVIEHQLVRDEAEAQRLGFVGSPTILVDGRDPFAQPGASPALACRIYRGGVAAEGSPTVEDLAEALGGRAG